jgi:hypothetical protein
MNPVMARPMNSDFQRKPYRLIAHSNESVIRERLLRRLEERLRRVFMPGRSDSEAFRGH